MRVAAADVCVIRVCQYTEDDLRIAAQLSLGRGLSRFNGRVCRCGARLRSRVARASERVGRPPARRLATRSIRWQFARSPLGLQVRIRATKCGKESPGGFTNRRSALSRPRALAFQWPRLSVSRAAPLTRLALAARAAGQKYDGHAAVFAFCAWPRPTYASSVRSRRVSAPDLPRAASGVCFFFVQVSWWSHS